MKRLVNQKLSDFNINGALQTLSGNSLFANPTKNLSTPFNKNTPKPQMTSNNPHPQMLIPH